MVTQINNIIPFKDRSIDFSKKVYIYRNLNNPKNGKKFYSISQNGLVVAHTNNLYIQDIELIVSQKGRERCLKDKKRNVHAKIKCFISDCNNKENDNLNFKLSYNPYKTNRLIWKNGRFIHKNRR